MMETLPVQTSGIVLFWSLLTRLECFAYSCSKKSSRYPVPARKVLQTTNSTVTEFDLDNSTLLFVNQTDVTRNSSAVDNICNCDASFGVGGMLDDPIARLLNPECNCSEEEQEMLLSLGGNEKSDQKKENNAECQCDSYNVWNDVMFVIDRSEIAGRRQYKKMYNEMLYHLTYFNVQTPFYKETNKHMRVGVVVYGSRAHLLAPLGTSLTNLRRIDPYSYYDYNRDYSTNLEEAISLANEELTAGRPSSRKVIVILATSFSAVFQHSPLRIANTIRVNQPNTFIIVYQYLEENKKYDEQTWMLKELASPGYYFNESETDITELIQAHCNINCFCPPPAVARFRDELNGAISGGCYHVSAGKKTYEQSEASCMQFGGHLVKIENQEKQSVVSSLINSELEYFVGLKWNEVGNSYRWLDETTMGKFDSFANYTLPTHREMHCVTTGGVIWKGWRATFCDHPNYYVCEAKPCDSNRYCQ